MLTVVGLGSQLSGDDAVGLILVDRLGERLADLPLTCVRWPDADPLTLAHDLLALPGAVVLVDCADMGLPPGSHRLLGLDEVRLNVRLRPVSVHGIGVAEALELARRLGFAQPVHLFAVQPYSVEPAAPLSRELDAELPTLVDALAVAVGRLARRGAPEPPARRSA